METVHGENGLASNLHIKEIRGRGLMIAIELRKPCGKLVEAALKRGCLEDFEKPLNYRKTPKKYIKDGAKKGVNQKPL